MKTMKCLWQRKGLPWPQNGQNFLETACGRRFEIMLSVVRGKCPSCGKKIETVSLVVEDNQQQKSEVKSYGR